MQLQMVFAGKEVGYFCVASPDFEQSGEVKILVEKLDKNFINAVISRAMSFWDKNIFNILMKNLPKK